MIPLTAIILSTVYDLLDKVWPLIQVVLDGMLREMPVGSSQEESTETEWESLGCIYT